MFQSKFLYEQFDAVSQMGLLPRGIPNYIQDNLNSRYDIRPYQKETFERFFYYLKEYPERLTPSHLLFNMATGSGKTLVMAGIILYLYKQGYSNFTFFVNSNNIIEKTKDNFLNTTSIKYLFKEKVVIDGKIVAIKSVDNFEGVSSENINICFTTIQKLHSDLHNERENSITFEDFKDKKIVLLSDEAHHIQAKTNQKSLGSELEKPSWENTVEQIFFQNSGNLLLEFTATLDFLNKDILEKYYPKIIYRYDLKEFRNDGYSKDVNILQSDLEEGDRILQAVILNQYRQEVASKKGIYLKPIILFKAQKTIEESKKNQEKFNKIIDNLEASDIQKIKKKSKINLIHKMFTFFEDNKISNDLLAQKIKVNFAPNKCLNVNEESLDKSSLKPSEKKEIVSQQNILNSLEDKNNQIRAIFSVQKLNEGRDVLNLFDIVRLYSTRDAKNNNPGKTTIAEAQLIGRGARYFPFISGDVGDKYKRKFDSDIESEMRILEELHYHSVNDNRYISELKTALIKEGLMDEEMIQKELMLKEEFKQQPFYWSGVIYLNEQQKSTYKDIKSLTDLGVSLRNIEYEVASGYGEDRAVFHNEDFMEQQQVVKMRWDYSLSILPVHIIRKALSKNNFYSFKNLKCYFVNMNSLSEFITSKEYLGGLSLTFIGAETIIKNLPNRYILNALVKLLEKIETEIKSNIVEYKGSDTFKPQTIKKIFNDKVLNIKKGDERLNGQEEFVGNKEWYVFNANYGTSEEKNFVQMLDRMIVNLEERYDEIRLFRNELHFKIYSFKDGRAFSPDFVLFLREKGMEPITYQIFIEPKGKHLKLQDKRKEDFLIEIKERYKDKLLKLSNEAYKVVGVPFYNNEQENEFKKGLLESISN